MNCEYEVKREHKSAIVVTEQIDRNDPKYRIEEHGEILSEWCRSQEFAWFCAYRNMVTGNTNFKTNNL